jgi:hypothetical protein
MGHTVSLIYTINTISGAAKSGLEENLYYNVLVILIKTASVAVLWNQAETRGIRRPGK